MTPERRAQIVGDLSAIFEDILEDEPTIDRMAIIMDICGEALAASISNREAAANELLTALQRDPGTAAIIRHLSDEKPK